MRLKEKYNKEIKPKLMEDLGGRNPHATPALKSVVLNVGVGRHSKEKDFVESVTNSLARISGQQPVLTKAKKSISSFKVRKGMTIGVKVTLRGKRMYDFVDKLVNITFPRVRDFRGLSKKSVDAGGNLTLGFKENLPFPEIRPDEIDKTHGLEVCLASTAENREDGTKLFEALGFPFKKDEKNNKDK
jgi:large subunit ribosomal protein L5